MWAIAGIFVAALQLVLYFGPMRWRHRRHVAAIPRLSAPDRDTMARGPRVAVLVPARNEQEAITPAIRSLMRQSYPRLRVIVANDRSTDATRGLLDRLLLEFPDRERLVVVDVPCDPPDGWMGKCHALWHATRQLREDEELLLFCDADVIHRRNTVAGAIADMSRHRVDLLAIFPRVDCRSFWESALMPVLVSIGLTSMDPRALNDPRRREVAGIGAFTMLRRAMYDSWGGHETIRGEVIDDMALALMVKQRGGTMRLCQADGGVHLRMYRGLGDIVRGFSKNAHTSFGGGMGRAMVVATGFGFVHLGWLLGGAMLIAKTTGLMQAAAVVLILMLWLGVGAEIHRRSAGFANANRAQLIAGYPLGVVLMMGIMLRSAWLGAVRGVVVWRGRTLRRPKQRVRML